MPLHLRRHQLPSTGASAQFQGFHYSPDVPLAIYFTTAAPGAWIEPHTHPYTEVFVLLAGSGTFIVAGQELVAAAGDVVVVLPNEVHEVRNTGAVPLRQLGLHCNGEFDNRWVSP